MATKIRQPQFPNLPEFNDPIIIERRIHIATVEPSPNGEHSMLGAAFLEIGNYMSGNDDDQGYDIEFKWGGRTFAASLLPSDAWMNRQAYEAEENH